MLKILRSVCILLQAVLFVSLGAQLAAAAELQFEVLSNEITLEINEEAVEGAVLNAGSIVQGGTFDPISFSLTNTTDSSNAISVSASVGSAENEQGDILQPDENAGYNPASGKFVLLYLVSETAPTQTEDFSNTDYLHESEKEIIANLAQEESKTVWLKLILAENGVALGSYTAPLTLSGQFIE